MAATPDLLRLIALILPQLWQNIGLNHRVTCLEIFDSFDQSLIR